jgi:F0F1-type ATP synthase assembly protein I
VLRRDVQGGSSLGSLVLMLPSVVMTTFIFRFTNHE